jgi:3',5'-cyclic AMP phosphodiesterase CpdA
MLLVFVATMSWGVATTVVKSQATASTILRPDSLKIVQMTDVHFSPHSQNRGARMLGSSQALLEDAIAQVNEMNDVDVVVFSGDSINSPCKQDLITFAQIANGLKYPWYSAIGNHETSVLGNLNKEKYFRILNTLNNSYSSLTIHDMALKPYYIISPKKDYKVIFLDGAIDARVSANGEFTDKQLAWLDEKLTYYKDKKVIIVQHFPVVEPFKSPTHKVLDAQQYLAVLDKHDNVVAVLSGHYHGSRVTKRNNVLHISTPSMIQYPNAFRVITISETPTATKVEIKTVETRLKDVQAQSKAAEGNSCRLLQGRCQDQNNVFYLSNTQSVDLKK